jgi:hypothetical protein
MPRNYNHRDSTARASARVVSIRIEEDPFEYIYDHDLGVPVPQPRHSVLDPAGAADANMDDFGAGDDDQPWPNQGAYMEELCVEDDADDDTWVHNAFKNARNKSGAVRALRVTQAGEVRMMAPVYNVATRQVDTEAVRVDLSQQAACIDDDGK